jgi:hypothetical protein
MIYQSSFYRTLQCIIKARGRTALCSTRLRRLWAKLRSQKRKRIGRGSPQSPPFCREEGRCIAVADEDSPFPLVPVRNGALRGGICTLGLWELEVELVGSVLPPGRSEGAWPLALFTRLQLARGSKIGGDDHLLPGYRADYKDSGGALPILGSATRHSAMLCYAAMAIMVQQSTSVP